MGARAMVTQFAAQLQHLISQEIVQANSRKREPVMKNSYDVPEALELGRTPSFIKGEKVQDFTWDDAWMGMGWRVLPTDIDESDE